MDFYLQSVRAAIESTTRGMDFDQLRAHSPGRWSAAEILDHLSRTFSGTVKVLQRVLDSGKPSARRPTWRDRLITLVVVDLGYFPYGRQAPDFALPRGMPAEEILKTILTDLAAMDQTIAECERRFGAKVRIADHPILGPFTVRHWRRFHWVHTRHHMKQIRRLRSLERLA